MSTTGSGRSTAHSVEAPRDRVDSGRDSLPAASGETTSVEVDAIEAQEAADMSATDLVGSAGPDFHAFYADHSESIARALGATLADAELGADAMAEGMTRAWQRWSRIGTYDNPAAWAYRVGLNWALSWKRKRRRERDRPVSFFTGVSVIEMRDDSVDAALADLSLEHRAVIACRIYLDWSVGATAEALDIAPGTVKSRLARALVELRRALLVSEATATAERNDGDD